MRASLPWPRPTLLVEGALCPGAHQLTISPLVSAKEACHGRQIDLQLIGVLQLFASKHLTG